MKAEKGKYVVPAICVRGRMNDRYSASPSLMIVDD